MLDRDERKKAMESDSDDHAIWLITTSDLSLLLLACFVLLFSMSSVEKGTFSESISSVQQALGVGESARIVRLKDEKVGSVVDEVLYRRQLVEAQNRLFAEVRLFAQSRGMSDILTGSSEDGKITLNMPAGVLFEPGSDTITPEGRKLLQHMYDLFVRHPDQDINVRGFTDSSPTPSSGRFRDNWDLSSSRAINVLRTLLDMGIAPHRITATGLADMNPLFPNTTEENRARNRRVEFVLEKQLLNPAAQ